MRVIKEHEVKIELELENNVPKLARIRKWQKDIRIHQNRLEILLSRLPQRRKSE